MAEATRVINYKGENLVCSVATDVWKFDTQEITTLSTLSQFFVSRANRPYSVANFEGDQSLVPEQRIFEVLAVCARIYATPGAGIDQPLVTDIRNLFETAYYEFQIQQVLTDRDNLFRLVGGADIFSVNPVGNVGFVGDGAWPNLRKYAVSRIVPGGRSIEFKVYWPTPVILAATCKLQIAMYGYELIPRGKA
jgi:hypothetical protein